MFKNYMSKFAVAPENDEPKEFSKISAPVGLKHFIGSSASDDGGRNFEGGITASVGQAYIAAGPDDSMVDFAKASSDKDSANQRTLESDKSGPYLIQQNLQVVLNKWSLMSSTPIRPDKFLQNLLQSRGYDTRMVASSELGLGGR